MKFLKIHVINGYAIARKIYARHQALTLYLVRPGVPEDIAREDACRMERGLSDESVPKSLFYYHRENDIIPREGDPSPVRIPSDACRLQAPDRPVKHAGSCLYRLIRRKQP